MVDGQTGRLGQHVQSHVVEVYSIGTEHVLTQLLTTVDLAVLVDWNMILSTVMDQHVQVNIDVLKIFVKDEFIISFLYDHLNKHSFSKLFTITVVKYAHIWTN
jgi:hypothetical protein